MTVTKTPTTTGSKANQTIQNKTKQNKTKQNKTKQNKTKQSKAKQSKTKQEVHTLRIHCSIQFKIVEGLVSDSVSVKEGR